MTPHELRRRRIALGLSYSAFAAPLGISPDEIVRWETSASPLPTAFVIELAVAYVELCVEAATSKLSTATPVRYLPHVWTDREPYASVR
jgi:transcriptional regulator with XRE-family HTH domain